MESLSHSQNHLLGNAVSKLCYNKLSTQRYVFFKHVRSKCIIFYLCGKMAAPKGNKNAVGNEGGAPSKYKNEYAEQAYRLCLLGAKDVDMAAYFDVDESTINNWKLAHIEFLEAIKKGKKIADIDVAEKLFERARGAEVVKQQAHKLKDVIYENGKKIKETERIELVELTEQVPPDTTALIFWLKNRSPENWKDKTEVDSKITLQPITGMKIT